MRKLLLILCIALAACGQNGKPQAAALNRQISTVSVMPANANISQKEQYLKIQEHLNASLPPVLSGRGAPPLAKLTIVVKDVDIDMSASTVATGMLIAPTYTLDTRVIVVDAQTGLSLADFPLKQQVMQGNGKFADLFKADSWSLSAKRDKKFAFMAESYAQRLAASLYPTLEK